MPLYEPDRQPTVAPADAIQVVHRFIERCDAWARIREIPKLQARLQTTNDPTDEASLHAWASYRTFLAHTLRELEDGTLDAWFTDPAAP